MDLVKIKPCTTIRPVHFVSEFILWTGTQGALPVNVEYTVYMKEKNPCLHLSCPVCNWHGIQWRNVAQNYRQNNVPSKSVPRPVDCREAFSIHHACICAFGTWQLRLLSNLSSIHAVRGGWEGGFFHDWNLKQCSTGSIGHCYFHAGLNITFVD